jgi:hypothetical protein
MDWIIEQDRFAALSAGTVEPCWEPAGKSKKRFTTHRCNYPLTAFGSLAAVGDREITTDAAFLSHHSPSFI